MSEGHRGEKLTEKTEEGRRYLTEAGKERLASWVTDVESDVYAFTPEADAEMVAAAMARLSRNPNDLRTIVADEFLDDKAREIGLLRRVVNTYGDDSVMQLFPIQAVFEGISNLATKEVERGRVAAYLEQSTRYLRFDKKDENGNYAYYTPDELDEETRELYEKYMDEIFDTYSALYEQLLAHIQATSTVPEEERNAAWRNACHAQACDGVRSLLPAATRATVGMTGSSQAFHNMILHLFSHELPEMQKLGSKALAAVRQVGEVFFERTDMPERGGLVSGNRRETREDSKALADRLLAHLDQGTENGPDVRLLSVDGSEDEVIAKIVFDASNHPYEVVHEAVEGLSDGEKQEVLRAYVGERANRRVKPGRAFELPHYHFEVVCDYGAFRDIQRHRMVDGLEWQTLQASLGHVTPEIIHDAGLADQYEHAFQLSGELYRTLQERSYSPQAQYATLFGHLMRFSAKVNARSLTHTAELRTSSQGHPAYRKVYQDMHDQVSEVHPNIAAAMKFVSQDENLELARLGAEQQALRRTLREGDVTALGD